MKQLNIVHLYPEDMNIYGDTGNRLVLEKRLEWRHIPYKVHLVNTGDSIPREADIILGGGGQDAGQQRVEEDLLRKASTLNSMAQDGVTMLMICGLYQLFGRAFITSSGETIKGAGILPLYTQAGATRIIGNITIQTEWGELVGYENHSGMTWLDDDCGPFGRVVRGGGNNGEDGTEGARHRNVFGSYLHGPILSKNPIFADFLLATALSNRGISTLLSPLDDTYEQEASHIAKLRTR